MSTERPGPGVNKFVRWIKPGIWEDGDGNLHVDVPAVNTLFGIHNTPESIAESMEIMEEVLKELHPDLKVITRTEP